MIRMSERLKKNSVIMGRINLFRLKYSNLACQTRLDRMQSGCYGKVYRGKIRLHNKITWASEETEVAIKVRNKDKCCARDDSCHSAWDDLMEASFLAQCEHRK